MADNVQELFGKISTKYDEQRPKLIPCFYDFYYLPLNLMSTTTTTATDPASPRILDVGAGTGLFSHIVLSKFPQARITLLDYTEEMLEKARKRFQGNDRIDYVVQDMRHLDPAVAQSFEGQFDYIISGLAIHHLTDDEKKDLYGHCYRWLKTGGLFINCDQILHQDPELETAQIALWHQKIRESGLDEEAITHLKERMTLDRCGTIPTQLQFFRDIGFKTSDVLYKYLVFCVFYAYK